MTNNYEQVSEMEQGTVFQFNAGAPWLRTLDGVRDLIPTLTHLESPIPESWKLNNLTVTVLYAPEVLEA